MVNPTFADYVDLLLNLFERFWHHDAARLHRGHPFVYEQKALIVFFLLMHQRRLSLQSPAPLVGAPSRDAPGLTPRRRA